MKIGFWGSDRLGSLKAIEYIYNDITKDVLCVMPEDYEKGTMADMCRAKGIRIVNPIAIDSNEFVFDLGVSYLYSKLISKSNIKSCKNGIINFHPAPLPEYKGVSGICYAICNGYKEWGVTCHYIDEKFDTGNIIKKRTFSLGDSLTGIEASNLVQNEMYALFMEMIIKYKEEGHLDSFEQKNCGEYHSRKEIEKLKIVSVNDNDIKKKVHGLFYPPYTGAYIEINGEKYTLIDDEILRKISEKIKEEF